MDLRFSNLVPCAVPRCLPFILILLVDDIKINPDPHLQNESLSFMDWNLNSLIKGNFERDGLIEARNAIFDYDLISVCGINYNDSNGIPDARPGSVSHAGVG